MLNKVVLSGFKCYSQKTIELGKINILTGNNANGKSSLIQAVLLMRSFIEKFGKSNGSSFELHLESDEIMPINDNYCLQLGTLDDIVNYRFEGKEVVLQFNEDIFRIHIEENIQDQTIKCDFVKATSKDNSDYLFSHKFYYLNAERLGPRFLSSNKILDFYHCGFNGEFTSYVYHRLVDKESFKIYNIRSLKSNTEKLQIQIDDWLDYIFPGTSLKVKTISNYSSQLYVRSIANNNKDILSTNMGFGITYCLPIIINCLIAEENSLVIIENPEAHLHPSAQSALGYFIGKVSNSNIQLIIETHSEHFINGLRVALLEKKQEFYKELNILFFNGLNEDFTNNIMKITIDEKGNLSEFPKDFFDQVRQDMLKIFTLNKL